MYAEGPFYIIQGSIIDGLVRSGLTVRMGGPNEGKLPLSPTMPCPEGYKQLVYTSQLPFALVHSKGRFKFIISQHTLKPWLHRDVFLLMISVGSHAFAEMLA